MNVLMMVLRMRVPLAGLVLALVLLGLLGLALLSLETTWTSAAEVVVRGSWGSEEGCFGRGGGADGRPCGPQALAVDSSGNVVVADSLNYRLEVFDRTGRLLEVWPLPVGVAPSRSEDERASAWALLVPCLSWGAGFRPYPDLAAPTAGRGEAVVPASAPDTGRPPYVTDLDLAGPGWRVDPRTGRLDPGTGPDVYLLAGWEGVVLVTDAAGNLRWARDLSSANRFLDLPPWSEYGAEPEPGAWAGYILGLDVLPGGGVVVSGYELLPDRLVFFVRVLSDAGGDLRELAAYSLLRDGSVRVSSDLPIALEVESVVVGHDGLLYLVAAAPEGPAPGPFAREVWVYTSDGRSKGRLKLDVGSYARHMQVLGVDDRGLVWCRVSTSGWPGAVLVFDGRGRQLFSIPLPQDAVVADAFLTPKGELYVSVAGVEGLEVVRHTAKPARRLVFRWAGRG